MRPTRQQLLSALAWCVENLPDAPPASFEQGWSPVRLTRWRDNKKAAARIALAAIGDGSTLAEPADVLFEAGPGKDKAE